MRVKREESKASTYICCQGQRIVELKINILVGFVRIDQIFLRKRIVYVAVGLELFGPRRNGFGFDYSQEYLVSGAH